MTDTIPNEVIEAKAKARHDAWAEVWRVVSPDEYVPSWEELSASARRLSMQCERAALSAADRLGWQMVPKGATEQMMLAGRKPIMARDCLNGDGHWTLGDHMREGGHEGWAAGDELELKTLSKGDCAVMTYRAMLAAAPKVK